MKKAGRILSLVLLIVMLATSFTFAESLELEKTYPRNGYKNAAIDGFGIKLFFNQDVSSEEFKEANEDCFVVQSEDGVKVPLIIVTSEEEEGMVLVLADITSEDYNVTENTKYTLTVSGDFTASSGETLGEDFTMEMTTLNQTQTQTVNMVIMTGMFAAIMVFGRKQDQKKVEVKEVDDKVNPYKVAKETGKSVEAIVEEDKKKKEKQAAKKAKKEARESKYFDFDDDDEEEEELPKDPFRQHVKGPRPISAGGSTYITGRKAAAEKARQKGTTNPKRRSGAKKKK